MTIKCYFQTSLLCSAVEKLLYCKKFAIVDLLERKCNFVCVCECVRPLFRACVSVLPNPFLSPPYFSSISVPSHF